ncbi:MAG: flagellar biosynthesis anti-sigma factor FlgM [Castellaniella sp.]|uniref:flagellar biosynthesis anti-sigma factor FlgM n=1 Tax=Castellaniella sp. TaxID=1955812 RepID=UPI00122AF022|nr:flagellar biosynthesis anti-sigma factor FlgM [Castellaniella sp.]TAN27707.1 MAG: flagellar biosynthesis anti-sigma factor FlgM [Castellaniella sp.]
MKINSTSSNPLLNGVSGTTRGESPSHANTGAATTSRSDVDLSPAARHLAALQDSAADVQTTRVQQIRDALASGDLRIDPSRIADGLLASVRDLLK